MPRTLSVIREPSLSVRKMPKHGVCVCLFGKLGNWEKAWKKQRRNGRESIYAFPEEDTKARAFQCAF